MIKYLELTAPDSNEFRQAKILAIEVNEGDYINVGDALFTVKSGSNTIPLPAKMSGKVVEMIAIVDEQITISTPLLLLETETVGSTATTPVTESNSENEELNAPPIKKKAKKKTNSKKKAVKEKTKNTTKTKTKLKSTATEAEPASKHKQQQLDLDNTPTPQNNTLDTDMTTIQISVPDIGVDSAKVIEIFIAVGDDVSIDDPLLSLESDKASMDIPSTHSGKVTAINVKLDQDVSEGEVIIEIEAVESEAQESASQTAPPTESTAATAPAVETPKAKPEVQKPISAPAQQASSPSTIGGHASPSIRRFARELGVDVSTVPGSGRKGRVTKEDVKQFIKGVMSGSAGTATNNSGGSGIPEIPTQDFSKFGEVDVQPLSKIKRLTAKNLHRSWLNVPHVTHSDESNISDLEDFRKQLNAEYAKRKKDIKLSPLAFIVKAVVSALETYPQFNSSLETGGENLIYKKYINVGIAVETPNGLVVPVIKGADKLSVSEIALAMGELAQKARDKKLTGADMSGGTFTISSLGGIGGTGFTPIVNAPEVAILGVSRNKMQPVWNGTEFIPGMILPLSLSYDHRVIDGAEAARFTRHIAVMLEDLRRLTV